MPVALRLNSSVGMPRISLSTYPESLKVSVWSKSLANRYCFRSRSAIDTRHLAQRKTGNFQAGCFTNIRCISGLLRQIEITYATYSKRGESASAPRGEECLDCCGA